MAGVDSFEDLDAWKLATELSDLVVRMTEKGRVLRDVRFVGQIRDSSASAPSNLDAALRLCRRAIGATTRYIQYLESCGGEVPGQPPRHSKAQRADSRRRENLNN
jgi:hypothetical protein